MRVGLMQEGHCPAGVRPEQRLHEMILEAVVAEETGWDFYGNGEQHFMRYEASVCSPEISHAAMAARTERIRFRPMSVNFLPYNHPIRIAEQVATLDVLSGGRAELGGARSNNPYTLDGFGIDARDTRRYRDEAIQIVSKALALDEFEHHGDVYEIPVRSLTPQPIQKPPPIYISATGIDSHRNAGLMGIGVMTGASILGWDHVQACFDAYKSSIEHAEPVNGVVNNSLSFSSIGVACAPTREQAKAHGGPVALRFVEVVVSIYETLSERSEDYAYLAQIDKIKARMRDLDYLMAAAPYITIGTPDDLIERATRMHSMGVDEIIWRLDGMGHEANLASIRLIGEEVLPVLHALPPHEGSAVHPGVSA
jgi:alkanesulfonate monooxygenase SsuD/methylene tetrahydromethanopterin reductase-like flavin-dependent oxidoreductase (luciferase family)